MKRRVKQLFKIIRDAEAELKRIREKCPHKTARVGLWSDRPGEMHNANICRDCGQHISWISEPFRAFDIGDESGWQIVPTKRV